MRILVTDAHELAGLGAIRSLGRAGHEVIAGYPHRLPQPASTYSRYCSAYRVAPDPWLSQPDFRTWLISNAADVDLILPISEAALLAAVSCRSQLPSPAALIAPPAASLDYTLSKRQATAKALALGIPCPPTAFARDELPGVRAPYIIRTDNRLLEDGSYRKGRTWYVENPDELLEALDDLTERGEKWMVQQYLVGTGAGGFLLRWRGQTLVEFAHTRVHEVPFHGGTSSLRKSVREPAMLATAAQLLAAIGYQGVAMIEFRRAAADQVPYFVEINGRLWGSLALALHCGADFPAKLVECYAGTLASPARAYAAGIYCRNVYPGETDYLGSVLTARGPVRGVRPPGKVRAILEFLGLFLRPRVHYDYLWLKDPLPWMRESLRACSHIVHSRWSNWRRAARRRRLIDEFAQRRLTAAPDLRRVLFLCYGNICRSAFAAAYWNQNATLATAGSAGFYGERNRRTPPRILRLAKQLGVDLAAHRSRVVDCAAIRHATAIFVMDGHNIEDLLSLYPQARAKSWLLGSFRERGAIRDPYLLADAEALEALRQVRESVNVILERHPSATGTAPGARRTSAAG
jgi:protein-tyrosine-phosphatase